MAALAVRAPAAPARGFHLEFVDVDTREQRQPLARICDYPFELVSPVRSFPSFRGQRNNTGWWWFATTRRHVGFESWLERDHVVRLDFDRSVVGLASQPFWLTWNDGDRARRHAPDYFARLTDGTDVVIDCRL